MGPLNLTSEKISFTFQRLLQTDGFGNFFDGLGDPVVISDIRFFYQNTAPTSPIINDRWMHSDTGREYVFIDDGTSSQWVQPYK